MLLKKEFIFTEKPYRYECHASTLIKKGDSFIAAWFEGTKEKASDVKIKLSVRKNGVWSEPITVSALKDTPHWNPVLFDLSDKIALYFKAGHEISDWVTYAAYSFDGGYSFKEPEILIEGDLSGGRGPVKNKPIRLKSGRILCPASTEKAAWLPFCDISDDNGKSFKKADIPSSRVSLIQPSFWQDEKGTVHAFMRSDKGYIYRSSSENSGETWCEAFKTDIPNNNSGLDLTKLEDGRVILACNPINKNWGARTPLTLFISDNNGESFKKLLDLETENGEFSYPAVINEKDKVYITYTHNRKNIVFAEIKI